MRMIVTETETETEIVTGTEVTTEGRKIGNMTDAIEIDIERTNVVVHALGPQIVALGVRMASPLQRPQLLQKQIRLR
jgi:hypothetical protein